MRISDPTQILADTVSNKARYGTRGFSSLPSMAELNPQAPHREAEFQSPPWRLKKKERKKNFLFSLLRKCQKRSRGVNTWPCNRRPCP